MALLDISEITTALMNVITDAFTSNVLIEVGFAVAPVVFPSPPVHMTEEETGIGMYLYHLAEDPHYKNTPPPGRDHIPIQYTPMGLRLFYHLSANDSTAADVPTQTINEQKMMGVAVKALRDNPEVNVIVNSSDNRLRICLNPIPPNEAVTFWTAGNSEVRLSTYYEVSVALLEPRESERPTSKVLSYGVHTFVQGAPRIISSENTIDYILPGTTNTRQLTASPAQVPFDNRFSLSGSGFNGSNIELLLINEGLGTTLVVDAADTSWQINVTKDKLNAIAGRMAIDQSTSNPIPLVPGIYGTQISVTRQRMMPDGQLRNFTHLSNFCPISIIPSITSVLEIAPNSTIFVVTGFTFNVSPERIRVYVQDVQLAVGTFNALLAAEYAVNPIPPLNPDDDTEMQINIPLLDNLGNALGNSGDHLPIRIFINGIESEPAWVQVP